MAQSAAAALAAEQEERRLAREGAKRVRATFGKLCKASGLAEADVDALRASLTIEQMQPIIEGFTAEEQSAQAKELFSTHLAALRAVEQAAARARDEAAAAAAAAKKQREAAAVWTEEEEAMLAKAIKLHAPGSGLRWHKVRISARHSAAQRPGEDGGLFGTAALPVDVTDTQPPLLGVCMRPHLFFCCSPDQRADRHRVANPSRAHRRRCARSRTRQYAAHAAPAERAAAAEQRQWRRRRGETAAAAQR